LEVKVNQEIREYAESMFFGLSIRQFFFSFLAVITAAVLYFALENKVGTEMVSWICIAGAVPFAAMGFVKYHGMNFEQLVWVWLRLMVLEPKQYKVRIRNLYEEATRESRAKRQQDSIKEECADRKRRRKRGKLETNEEAEG